MGWPTYSRAFPAFPPRALRYAPTPQAKGKIERRHADWPKRLPPLLAADRLRELAGANALPDQLLPHVLTVLTGRR